MEQIFEAEFDENLEDGMSVPNSEKHPPTETTNDMFDDSFVDMSLLDNALNGVQAVKRISSIRNKSCPKTPKLEICNSEDLFLGESKNESQIKG